MDLRKLKGQRKYRIMMPSSKIFQLVEKFLNQKSDLLGCLRWRTSSKGKRFCFYSKDAEFNYLITRFIHPVTKAKIKKIRKKY